MRLYVNIPFNNVIRTFSFLNGTDFSEIFIDGFCCIVLHKLNNHSYFAKGYFYNSRTFILDYETSKSKLYDFVQKCLQEELLYVKQFC